MEKHIQSDDAADSMNLSIKHFGKLIDGNFPLKCNATYKLFTLVLRCTCFRATSRFEEAIADAKNYKETMKNSIDSYVLLSQCLCDAGKFSRAIDEANSVIDNMVKNSPYRAWAFSNRGKIVERIGQQAAKDFRESEEISKRVGNDGSE